MYDETQITNSIETLLKRADFITYIELVKKRIQEFLNEIINDSNVSSLLIDNDDTFDAPYKPELKSRNKRSESIIEKFIRKNKINTKDLDLFDPEKVFELVTNSLDDYLAYTLLTQVSSNNKDVFNTLKKIIKQSKFNDFSIANNDADIEANINSLKYYKIKINLQLDNVLKGNNEPLTKYPKKIYFELQIKSQFVSAYSNIEHSILYKNTVVSYNDSAVSELFQIISRSIGVIEEEIEQSVYLFKNPTDKVNRANIMTCLIERMPYNKSEIFYSLNRDVANVIFNLLLVSDTKLINEVISPREYLNDRLKCFQIKKKYNEFDLRLYTLYEIIPYSDELIRIILLDHRDKLPIILQNPQEKKSDIDVLLEQFFDNKLEDDNIYEVVNDYMKSKLENLDTKNTIIEKALDLSQDLDLDDDDSVGILADDLNFDSDNPETTEKQRHKYREFLVKNIKKIISEKGKTSHGK